MIFSIHSPVVCNVSPWPRRIITNCTIMTSYTSQPNLSYRSRFGLKQRMNWLLNWYLFYLTPFCPKVTLNQSIDQNCFYLVLILYTQCYFQEKNTENLSSDGKS